MLRKSLTVLAGAALLSSFGAVVSSPSYADAAPIQFSCDTSGSLPATLAQNTTTGKTLPVIRWYSEYFTGSGYDPITRCQQVSGRFQSAYNSGALDYMTAGIVNGLPVVCAASPGSGCNGSNVLFTLKKGVNAAETLQRLFDVRDLGAGPLFESSNRTYVSLKKKLAPLNGQAGSNAPATRPSGNTQPSAAPTKPGRAF